MNVLLANKFLYDHGGPETVCFATGKVLRLHGHQVVDFAMADLRNRTSSYRQYFPPNISFDEIGLLHSPITRAVRFVHSRPAMKGIGDLLREHPVDIAHLHSINHQLTPSIISVLRNHDVPVVMTLHDYKLVCPAYTLLANGAPCERCSGKQFFEAVRTRCRGGARSTLLAAESYFHHSVKKSYDGVSVFVSPSMFLAEKFAEMGFDREIIVIPNPIEMVETGERVRGEDYFLFVGRLVEEKGVRTLLRAVENTAANLRVVGTGPIKKDLMAEAATGFTSGQVKFLGEKRGSELDRLIRGAIAVVVPSQWYENQPMVILEAYARGTPVIASNIGGNAELVTSGATGLTYDPWDVEGLASRLAWASANRSSMEKMGVDAKTWVETYSVERYYDALVEVYDRALSK